MKEKSAYAFEDTSGEASRQPSRRNLVTDDWLRRPALCLTLLAFTFLAYQQAGRLTERFSNPSPEVTSRINSTPCNPHSRPGRLRVDFEQPLNTFWEPFDKYRCSPERFLQRLSAGDIVSLPQSLLHKTVLAVGDEIDRDNVEFACSAMGGEYEIINPEHPLWPQSDVLSSSDVLRDRPQANLSWPRICKVSSIDLVIVSVFHWGLDQWHFFDWNPQYGQPNDVEERISEIAVPIMAKIGRKVDLVSWNTAFWDLAHFGRMAYYDMKDRDVPREQVIDLSDTWTSFYYSRYKQALLWLMRSFPDAGKISVRLCNMPGADVLQKAQQRWKVEENAEIEDVPFFSRYRISEVSQGAKQAVFDIKRKIKRPLEISTWHELVIGRNLTMENDVFPTKPAAALWAEMMLYDLHLSNS